MPINKETELIRSIMIFFHRCAEEGDYDALYEMGFGPSEVRALSSLSTADTLRLASMKSHFLMIKLDRSLYWRLIDYILRENAQEKLINELVNCDASPQMMHALTGMNRNQFKIKRFQLGLPYYKRGRPAIPTLEVEKMVWQAVQRKLQATKDLGPQEILDIFNALKRQVDLRTIWILIRDWDSDGSLRCP